jgi:DNA modification methylase
MKESSLIERAPDCFCGAGTTLEAAENLGGRLICVDNSPLAIVVTIKRLLSMKNRSVFTLYNAVSEPLAQILQEVL